MTETKMTIAQALALFETDPQAGYREAADILHKELIRLNKLNQNLIAEIKWAWDNLATEEQGLDVLGEVSDIPVCVVCGKLTYKHSPNCQVGMRRKKARELVKGDSDGDSKA